MILRNLASLILLAAGVSAWAFEARAAEPEPCLRDVECEGQRVCLGGSCQDPPDLPTRCASDDDCSAFEACVANGCKHEGIACDNPAGRCWLVGEYGDAGECTCADGQGSGWSGGFNPEDPPTTKTDEEILEMCHATLVENCGTEAPTLPESCTGTVRTDCEALVAKENAIAMVCGDGTASDFFRLGQCCDDYDDPTMREYRECVMELPAEACDPEAVQACVPEGTPRGSDSDGGEPEGDPAGDAEEDGTQKLTCSIAREDSWGAAWSLVWFAPLALRKRRRSRACRL